MVSVVRPLRVVFLGTPAFALATLDALLASPHPVVGVVTQPDRPRGRGQRTTDAPVKARASEAGLPTLQPTALKDPTFLRRLADLGADLGVVAAYGRILPEEALVVPRLGMINVHGSLLPRYRGAAPVHRAVMAGEPLTGVTIMRVVRALDAGPMLMSVERPIGSDETSAEVEADLAITGAHLLVRAVDALSMGAVPEVPQDEHAATYAPPLRKEEGLIDWTQPAGVIHNRVRGLHPWPHAFAFTQGHRVIVRRSAPLEAHAEAAPGTIVMAARDDLLVAAGSGLVRLIEVQPEGKRPMGIRDFLAGHRVAVGDRLGGP